MNASKPAAQCDFMPAAYFGEIPQDFTVSPSHRHVMSSRCDRTGRPLSSRGAYQ